MPRAKALWKLHAACRGLDSDIFFKDDEPAIDHALSICAGCPVRLECLRYAITEVDGQRPEGVFGGMTARERDKIRRKKIAI